MASPVGHALLGLAVAHAAVPRHGESDAPAATAEDRGRARRRRWVTLAVVAVVSAIAPDFDFFPGIVAGDPNRYHQLYSHAVVAAPIFGLVTAGVARTRVPRAALSGLSPGRVGVLASVAYGSHIFLDFFTYDSRAPFGIPLFWPVTTEHFTSPWAPLRGLLHGVPGQGLHAVLGDIFSLHNLAAIGIEVGFTLPALVVVHLIIGRRPSRTSPGEGRH